VLALSVAVSVGSVVVLAMFLTRYRKLTDDLTKATQLNKNIYDAMNSRLSVMDARIIDLMAKVEIYGARSSREQPKQAKQPPVTRAPAQTPTPGPTPLESPSATDPVVTALASRQANVTRSEEVEEPAERPILRLLLQGPKTAPQLVDLINRSREHTERVMKNLYEKGLVTRNTDRTRPFTYQITDAGRRYLESQ